MAHRIRGKDQPRQAQLWMEPRRADHHRWSPNLVRTRRLRPQPRQGRNAVGISNDIAECQAHIADPRQQPIRHRPQPITTTQGFSGRSNYGGGDSETLIVEELLSDPALRRFASQPEMDPVTREDALQEAQLLDVRLNALRLTVGLLFELRLALQLRESNTGVLVARGVCMLSWPASPGRPPRRRGPSSSIPRNDDGCSA